MQTNAVWLKKGTKCLWIGFTGKDLKVMHMYSLILFQVKKTQTAFKLEVNIRIEKKNLLCFAFHLFALKFFSKRSYSTFPSNPPSLLH